MVGSYINIMVLLFLPFYLFSIIRFEASEIYGMIILRLRRIALIKKMLIPSIYLFLNTLKFKKYKNKLLCKARAIF